MTKLFPRLTPDQEKAITYLIEGYPVAALAPQTVVALKRKAILVDDQLAEWARNRWLFLHPEIKENSVDPSWVLLDSTTRPQLLVLLQVVDAMGVCSHGEVILSLRRKGLIKRIGRGKYKLAPMIDAAWDDWAAENDQRIQDAFRARPRPQAPQPQAVMSPLLLLGEKEKRQFSYLTEKEKGVVQKILENRPRPWTQDDVVAESKRYIEACLMDRRITA